jgi:hypothetical protein
MQTVLLECGTRCGISTERDWKTITQRVENEGLEFLTITLPEFCLGLERALDRRRTVPDDWTGWSKRGKTPKFLGEFLDFIFDRENGRFIEDILTDEIVLFGQNRTAMDDSEELARLRDLEARFHRQRLDQAEAIACIRQVTRAFSKLEVEASNDRIDLAFNDFLNCERDMKSYLETGWEGIPGTAQYTPRNVGEMGRLLYGEIFAELSKRALRGLSDTEARTWLYS